MSTMKRMFNRQVLGLAACGFLFVSPLAKAATVQDLAWLAGAWEGAADGMQVDYQYGAPKGGLILGQGRFTVDGALAFYEFETIREDAGNLILTPSPFGQPGVSFTATEVAPGHVVFANPDHDFPSVIEYRLEADGSLYSRAAGTENGVPKVIEYTQKHGV